MPIIKSMGGSIIRKLVALLVPILIAFPINPLAPSDDPAFKQWEKAAKKRVLEKKIHRVPKEKKVQKPDKNKSTKNKREQKVASRQSTGEMYTLTAYTAGPESTGKRPGDPGYGITASGARVQEGVTVACPPSLPLGTVVEIEGLGKRICHDRGGAIKGKKLDVYMESLTEARQFGVQKRKVKILKEE